MVRLPLALVIAAVLAPATAAAAPAPLTALTAPHRFGKRVHVAHVGSSGLTPGQLTDDRSARVTSIWAEYVVVETAKAAVRIVVDHDEARLLLWIPTSDLAWTVGRATRIVGRGATGVWVLPGAPLTISGTGRRVAAGFDDDNVTIHGTIARAALTQVFAATVAPPATDQQTAQLAREPAGPALVTTKAGLGVAIVGAGPNDWRLVEHRGRYLRIVGWARAGELSDGGLDFGTIGTGSYGMSDTQRVEVPAGACLFDPASGDKVGIQTTTSTRYAGDEGGGRWWVYVGTDWGLRTVVVRDLAGGHGDPRWQMCR